VLSLQHKLILLVICFILLMTSVGFCVYYVTRLKYTGVDFSSYPFILINGFLSSLITSIARDIYQSV
jgi:uncharacterized membrane protein